MSAVNAIAARHLVVDHASAGGTVRALDLDRFEVDGGDSISVMGPSGCGKSTLLGLLAGLATPTSGTVTIGDTEVSALTERGRVRFRRRSLGMVYQVDNLLPYLTVEENVGLAVAVAGRADDPSCGGQVESLLDRLGLAQHRTRLPDQLSGGQRQRVAIARAVAHRPAVILADEPTGSLDRDNALAVLHLLVAAHRDIGATLVLVTHDPEMASHADRVVELRHPGRAEVAAGAG